MLNIQIKNISLFTVAFILLSSCAREAPNVRLGYQVVENQQEPLNRTSIPVQVTSVNQISTARIEGRLEISAMNLISIDDGVCWDNEVRLIDPTVSKEVDNTITDEDCHFVFEGTSLDTSKTYIVASDSSISFGQPIETPEVSHDKLVILSKISTIASMIILDRFNNLDNAENTLFWQNNSHNLLEEFLTAKNEITDNQKDHAIKKIEISFLASNLDELIEQSSTYIETLSTTQEEESSLLDIAEKAEAALKEKIIEPTEHIVAKLHLESNADTIDEGNLQEGIIVIEKKDSTIYEDENDLKEDILTINDEESSEQDSQNDIEQDLLDETIDDETSEKEIVEESVNNTIPIKKRYILNYEDKVFEGSKKLYLKNAISKQYGKNDFCMRTVRSVKIIAKSKNGDGTASLYTKK